MVTSVLRNLSTGIFGATCITLVTTVATPSQATTLTLYSTYGDDMAGMQVTANFVGGGSETVRWRPTSDGYGGAFGNDWSLIEGGDTFLYPWRLENNGRSIASLAIEAIPGNAVFDVISGAEVTPGSADGFAFQPIRGRYPTSHNYSVPIDISQGDLFGTLSLSWDRGFGDGDYLYFYADTDSGTASDPVRPLVSSPPTVVAEPPPAVVPPPPTVVAEPPPAVVPPPPTVVAEPPPAVVPPPPTVVAEPPPAVVSPPPTVVAEPPPAVVSPPPTVVAEPPPTVVSPPPLVVSNPQPPAVVPNPSPVVSAPSPSAPLPTTVPEPSSVLGILTLGALGGSWRLLRKQQYKAKAEDKVCE